jgi:hypothetical protein
VTEIDETPSGRFYRVTRDVLGDTTEYPPGSLVAHYIGVAMILLPSGATKIVRTYPCGPLSGSTERGMLADALSDSNYERDSHRRPN